MSKHDFTAAEFADRLSRVRAALAAEGLDWLVAVHPVSIHWLTGTADSSKGWAMTSTSVGPPWATAAATAVSRSSGSSTRQAFTPKASATRAWSVRSKSTEK